MTTATADRAPARRVRAGQIVVAQAAVALPVALAPYGTGAVGAGAAVAVAVLGLAWVRARHRWLYQWLGVWLDFAVRHRAPVPGPDGLLAFAAPGTRILPATLAGDEAAVLADGYGLTAVVEIGAPDEVLPPPAAALPDPVALRGLAAPDGPPVSARWVLHLRPAPAAHLGGPVAASYRQLTAGRTTAAARTLLALRAPADRGTDAELRGALSAAVRRLYRRHPELAARALGPEALRRALADLAHHDPDHPRHRGDGCGGEGWGALRLGPLVQAGYRLQPPPTDGRLLEGLRALPAAAVTVAGSDGPYLTVRLAAPDPAGLAVAHRALVELAAGHGVGVRTRDGRQRLALAATLPLGSPTPPPGSHTPPHRAPAPPPAGLMLGAGRDGAPVLARLFRAVPTRALLVGGVPAAQVVVLRALALGARVVVETTRPAAWEPFARAAGPPGAEVVVRLPGAPGPAAAAGPLRPVLAVRDAGPAGHDLPADAAWHAQLVVREALGAGDSATLALADLVVLQPLTEADAALVGDVLGLGEAAGWLTRIRPDMVGVVSRRTLCWATLSLTATERQLTALAPPR